jgi:hypothetical protein
MIAFTTPAAEAGFRFRSNEAAAHNYGRIARTCCKCGRERQIGDLIQANAGPWTIHHPRRLKCKGGCNAR